MERTVLMSIRYNGRHYVRRFTYPGSMQDVGALMIANIPAEPKRYQEWLQKMRSAHAQLEALIEVGCMAMLPTDVDSDSDSDSDSGSDSSMESDVEIDDIIGDIPQIDENDDLFYAINQLDIIHELPTAFPMRDKVSDSWTRFVIDIDREILTINNAVHWKLNNIPRAGQLWYTAISRSIYLDKDTIRLDMGLDDHIARPAIALPAPDNKVDYNFLTLTPVTDVGGQARTGFLVRSLASVIVSYRRDITRFGTEWSTDSFPFRELIFALMSIAADEATFIGWEGRRCNPFWPCGDICGHGHTPAEIAWLTRKLIGDTAPLPKFGVPCHRPGEQPGASPAETMYFVRGVLVRSVLVVDNKAMSDAAKWGLEQGHSHFQIVVTSLFNMSFGEMTTAPDGTPLLKLTDPIPISPLRPAYCLSGHPRDRPVLPDGAAQVYSPDERIFRSDATGSPRRLKEYFPALAALVNFFDIAARRRVGHRNVPGLPIDVWNRILDYTDDETWRNCQKVAEEFLSYGQRQYRAYESVLLAGPSVRLLGGIRLLSFVMKGWYSGQKSTLAALPDFATMGSRTIDFWSRDRNFMPVIGKERKVIINSPVSFRTVPNAPVEPESDDEVD